MDESSARGRTDGSAAAGLPVAAGAVAYVVAAIHLFHPSHGFARLVLVLSADPALLLIDPRPLAFVLAGGAILLAVPAVIRGAPRRPVYALGAALMVATLLGYLAWHLSGHGGFLPGREPLYHGMGPLAALASHLATDPWAAVSVVTELLLLGLLVALLRQGNAAPPARQQRE